jgi:hypothetical protein
MALAYMQVVTKENKMKEDERVIATYPLPPHTPWCRD